MVRRQMPLDAGRHYSYPHDLPLSVAQRSTETSDPLDFLVPQCQVSSDAGGVLELRVTCNLMMSLGAHVCLGGVDERSPDASSLKSRFHVPAFDEWHW